MNLQMAVNTANSHYQENDIDVDMFLANDPNEKVVPAQEVEYGEMQGRQAPKRKETPTRPQGRTKRRVQNSAPRSGSFGDAEGPPPKRYRQDEEREGGEVDEDPQEAQAGPQAARSAIPAIIHQPLPGAHLPRLAPLMADSPLLPPIQQKAFARGMAAGGAVEALTVVAAQAEEMEPGPPPAQERAPISEKMKNLKLRLSRNKKEGEPVPVHKKLEAKPKAPTPKERTSKDLNHILDNNSSPSKRGMKRRHSQLGEEDPRQHKQQPEPLHHLGPDPSHPSPSPSKPRSTRAAPPTPPHDSPPASRKASQQARPKRTSRSNSELVSNKSDEDYENDTDDDRDAKNSRTRPKRERKRTASVQRAIDEEINRGRGTKKSKSKDVEEPEPEQKSEEEPPKEKEKEKEKKEKPKPKQKPKPKPKKPKTRQRKPSKPPQSDEDDDDENDEKVEKASEDGVLAIDKFLLKRFNTETNEIEYLVQWNGYDIHKSGWIGKKDIFAAEYLNEFEKEWAEVVERKKKKAAKPPDAPPHPPTEPDKDNEPEQDPEKKPKRPAPAPPRPPPQDLSVGDKVWVKLKGHQWWPAQIVVHKQPAPDKNDYTVIYYGENTFSFVNDYNPSLFSMEVFEGSEEKYRKKANERAVKEALVMRLDDSFE